jgi:integrase
VTDRKQAPAGYVAWNDIELKKIFERDIMAGVKKYRDMIYWGPLLALYTGARTNELSQLLLSDIIEWHDHDGQNKIWCLSITDLPSEDEDEPPAYAEGEGPRVKNPSSRRIVPLHPILFTLGFWDYVDYLKGMGETRLFKDASFEEASGYGRRMSRAWREISQDLGIWKHRKKVFHSFRSTLNGRLTKVGTPLDRCELMLGHANNSTNREYYTCPEDMPIDELFRFLARVDFKLKHHPWTRPEVWGTLPEKL